MEILSHTVSESFVLPAGTYIISDPCYVVENEKWGELLDSCDFFMRSALGTYTRDDKTIKVISFSTAWGDGTYRDNFGRKYGVDAGMIGIMSADDFPELMEDPPVYVNIVEFPEQFIVSSGPVRGIMQFGDIKINTGDDEYDEEDDE